MTETSRFSWDDERTISASSHATIDADSSSVSATACSTLSPRVQLKNALFYQHANQGFRKKHLQRLPIPSALTKGAKDGDKCLDQAAFTVPDHRREEDAPQSLHLQVGTESKSRVSLSTQGLALAIALNRRPSKKNIGNNRHRSVSDPFGGRELHPPPPSPSLRTTGEVLTVEPLVVKKKVIKRKPIPFSLFLEAQEHQPIEQRFESETLVKSRSQSVPDIFPLLPHDNKLGLFIPTQHQQKQGSVAIHSDSVNDKVASDLTLQECISAPPTKQRLKRATRSISETHPHRSRTASNSDKVKLDLHSAAAGIAEQKQSSSNASSPTTDSSSGSGEENKKVRARSGSAPCLPSSQVHSLRRVSRRREGEMRSVYLFPPPPPVSSFSSFPQIVSTSPEPVEILKTPEPNSQPSSPKTMPSSTSTFQSPPSSYSFATGGSFDSIRSIPSSVWDCTLSSTSSGVRASSETHMASLFGLAAANPATQPCETVC